MDDASPLISTDALQRRLGAPDFRVLDGSWRMPGQPHARSDFEQRRIPGAQLFDIDLIADQSTDLPHMAPSPEVFAAAVSALGVGDGDDVVVYDDAGIFSAARVWWTFRAMGHENVRVLDGGLKKWIAEGRAIDVAPPTPPTPRAYAARLRPLVRSDDDVRRALATPGAVIDARPAARFLGTADEPRAGLLSGAMPGAVNVPFASLLREDGTMRPPSELETIFADAGVSSGDIIATCGSGVTAAVVLLSLAAIGRGEHGLYDGSWAEWGRSTNDRKLFPVVRPKT
jgi:thiosulfate/3-mercaptopyruvate sulfurtransferase